MNLKKIYKNILLILNLYFIFLHFFSFIFFSSYFLLNFPRTKHSLKVQIGLLSLLQSVRKRIFVLSLMIFYNYFISLKKIISKIKRK